MPTHTVFAARTKMRLVAWRMKARVRRPHFGGTKSSQQRGGLREIGFRPLKFNLTLAAASVEEPTWLHHFRVAHTVAPIGSFNWCSASNRARILLPMSSEFERPAPDLAKILTAWEEWERGEQNPGKVLTNMKTAGLAEVLRELTESGWKPSVHQ